jgi:formylglycine-generating enzyme required for sulfatase activity
MDMGALGAGGPEAVGEHEAAGSGARPQREDPDEAEEAEEAEEDRFDWLAHAPKLIAAAAAAALLVVILLVLWGAVSGDTDVAPADEELAAETPDPGGEGVADRPAEPARETAVATAEDIGPRAREAAVATVEDAGRPKEEGKPRDEIALLDAEAKSFYESLSRLHEAEAHQEVVDKAKAVGDRYVGTAYGGGIKLLEQDASNKLEKKLETERRYSRLIRQARDDIDNKAFDSALAALRRAELIEASEEVDRLTREAKGLVYLSQADAAEKAGRLEEAVELCRRAVEITRELEVAERIGERIERLEGRAMLRRLLAEAEAGVQRKDWLGALEAYRNALPHAEREEERKTIGLCIENAEREFRYAEAVRKARGALEGRRWREAIRAADEALAAKPGAADALEVVRLARRRLGPEKRVTNSIGMTFVLVPAGEFTMGSPHGDSDETPVRKVRLDHYYIGVHEVTNAQFEKFDPSHRKWREPFSPDDDMPAVMLSWTRAAAFCRWLSEREGVDYRLPTEAEWESAARGGERRTYPWGEMPPGDDSMWRCNIAPQRSQASWAYDGYDYASPVGAYPDFASPHGVHDLAGNVWEWCFDWYRADYYALGEGTNPAGPSRGRQRVLRGGSFANDARAARCSNRTAKKPGYREATIGFRVVRVVDWEISGDRAETSGKP